jgi:hypothetical protein
MDPPTPGLKERFCRYGQPVSTLTRVVGASTADVDRCAPENTYILIHKKGRQCLSSGTSILRGALDAIDDVQVACAG